MRRQDVATKPNIRKAFCMGRAILQGESGIFTLSRCALWFQELLADPLRTGADFLTRMLRACRLKYGTGARVLQEKIES